MEFSSFTKDKRLPLLKLRTYYRSSGSENALMVSLRLRSRKEVSAVRKVKDEEEVEMIRAKLAKKLRFDFRDAPNIYTGHNKKSSDVHSIQDKLCKKLSREVDHPVNSSYVVLDST